MEKETEQPASELNSEKRNQLKATFLTSPEGRPLLAGVALAFIYTFWLGIKLLLSPEPEQAQVSV